MSQVSYKSDDETLQEMVSYRKNVTGISHTIFISPRGNARHGPRIKIAINPLDALDPRSTTAVVSISGWVLAGGVIEPSLLKQVRKFLAINHSTLQDYWDYKIDTDELRQRLKSID
jgi:hypothetical protein